MRQTIKQVTSSMLNLTVINNKVSCLGDSITQPNSGITTGGICWPEIMCAVTGARLRYSRSRNYATTGKTSTEIRTEQLPLALADDSTFVTLMCGANNIASPSTIISDIDQMVSQILRAGKYVILSTMTPNNDLDAAENINWDQVNTYIRNLWRSDDRIIGVDMAKAGSVRAPAAYNTLPAWASTVAAEPYTDDGLHPNWVGIWALGAVAGDVLNTYDLGEIIGPSNSVDYGASNAGEIGNPLTSGTAGVFVTARGSGELADLMSEEGSSAVDSIFSKVARTDGLPGEWQYGIAATANSLRAVMRDFDSDNIVWTPGSTYWLYVEVLYKSSDLDTVTTSDAQPVFTLWDQVGPVEAVQSVSAHVPGGEILEGRHVIYASEIVIPAEAVTDDYYLKVYLAPYTTDNSIGVGRIWREEE